MNRDGFERLSKDSTSMKRGLHDKQSCEIGDQLMNNYTQVLDIPNEVVEDTSKIVKSIRDQSILLIIEDSSDLDRYTYFRSRLPMQILSLPNFGNISNEFWKAYPKER
uniref:Uncharacterized protein n=1 Tax=Heterorhabditis bacteriophora TaxID=37862 RepID=A0A1I7XF91_HETBA